MHKNGEIWKLGKLEEIFSKHKTIISAIIINSLVFFESFKYYRKNFFQAKKIKKLTNIIFFLKNVLPILLVIFIAVLCSILLVRAVLTVILMFARKKYAKLVEYKKSRQEKVLPKKDSLPKEDSALFRAKEGLAPPKLPMVQKMPNPALEENRAELEEVKIVDIVKPVGFWTSVILGQKLTYLVSSAQLMNKNSRKGFWVSMIEAQEKAQGRQKGRSL
jgi:predicted signal transduction protein with EAL and GGDEF domain